MFDCSVGEAQSRTCKKVWMNLCAGFEGKKPLTCAGLTWLFLYGRSNAPFTHWLYSSRSRLPKRFAGEKLLDKALKEQGIDGKATKRENSTHTGRKEKRLTWTHYIGNKYGIERAEETGINRKHMSIDQYKAVAEQIANEVQPGGNRKSSCIAK